MAFFDFLDGRGCPLSEKKVVRLLLLLRERLHAAWAGGKDEGEDGGGGGRGIGTDPPGAHRGVHRNGPRR